MVTVRSDEKGQRILDAHPNTPKEKLSYVVVKDVAADGAFDDVSWESPILLHPPNCLPGRPSNPTHRSITSSTLLPRSITTYKTP